MPFHWFNLQLSGFPADVWFQCILFADISVHIQGGAPVRNREVQDDSNFTVGFLVRRCLELVN